MVCYFPRLLVLVVVSGFLAPLPFCRAADPPVSLELLTEPGFRMTRTQRWIGFLTDVGFAPVRIRGARPGEEAKITRMGTDNAPRYRVRGLLNSRGMLHVPGATIRYGQRRELTAWLAKLRHGGKEAATSPTGVFGLTAKQLLHVHDALAAPVAQTTRGTRINVQIQQIASSLGAELLLDTKARSALRSPETVSDELRGVSCGTALVALLRPLGLELVPTTPEQGKLRLKVLPTGIEKDQWPLGWKPKKPTGQIAPALLKFVPVEIADTPLTEALDAIHKRLNIPILIDHNALARREVDIAMKVSLPQTKTFYKKIIDRLLYQAKLKCDLRVDEADHPFLWITTLGG